MFRYCFSFIFQKTNKSRKALKISDFISKQFLWRYSSKRDFLLRNHKFVVTIESRKTDAVDEYTGIIICAVLIS